MTVRAIEYNSFDRTIAFVKDNKWSFALLAISAAGLILGVLGLTQIGYLKDMGKIISPIIVGSSGILFLRQTWLIVAKLRDNNPDTGQKTIEDQNPSSKQSIKSATAAATRIESEKRPPPPIQPAKIVEIQSPQPPRIDLFATATPTKIESQVRPINPVVIESPPQEIIADSIAFNEVLRRLNNRKEIEKRLENLPDKDAKIKHLVEIKELYGCSDIWKDKDFPYYVLEALRQKKISQQQFGSFMLFWEGINCYKGLIAIMIVYL